jgi:NitT/TauT family transport system substrate-binding protein
MTRLLAALLALAGLACGGSDDGTLALALNWKPEPEFGGVFEAERVGAFEKRGLHVARTGGPGAPVVQMVTAKQVAFGIASADEVVMARDRGSDVVAVFATYQTSPQGLMAHAARGADSLAALLASPGTLAVEPGLPYVKFLEKRYGLGAQQVVPYSYSIAPFLEDPQLAQQVFVTSEPIAARRAGADARVFLIAESGYNPYTAVVIAHGDTLREDRERVAAFVAALREGWAGYLADPAPANAVMAPENPEMDAEAFRLAAEAQAPLIAADGVPVGAMTAARWTELARQLEELGLIGEPQPAERYFADFPLADQSASRAADSRICEPTSRPPESNKSSSDPACRSARSFVASLNP